MDEETMTAESSRNSLQQVAMTAIYDALTYRQMGMDIDVQDIVSSLCEAPYESCDYFVKAAIVLSLKHLDEAIAAFNANMKGWTFDRRNRVEQAILLLAYVHFYYIEPDVDKGVVIDIAVKQAKRFLDDKAHRFVNAVLDHTLTPAS